MSLTFLCTQFNLFKVTWDIVKVLTKQTHQGWLAGFLNDVEVDIKVYCDVIIDLTF